MTRTHAFDLLTSFFFSALGILFFRLSLACSFTAFFRS
jgi:hypothetical protein